MLLLWGRAARAPGCLHLFDPNLLFVSSLCFASPRLCPADSEDDGESEAAKQLIQPIAEKIIAKYKAKEEEAPLLFFVAGEVSRRGTRELPASTGLHPALLGPVETGQLPFCVLLSHGPQGLSWVGSCCLCSPGG